MRGSGSPRPPKRLVKFWVVLVSVRGLGVGVFPPETPRGGEPPTACWGTRFHGCSPGGGSGAPFRWGAGVGGVVSTTGDLMVVIQYRLLVVSLRVLVGKDAPVADREWWSMVSRIRRARG